MNIYIDESGSINKHNNFHSRYFVIAMVHVLEKNSLSRAYKRFVSSNHDRLIELDEDKVNMRTGRVIKHGRKMFVNGRFKELKGVQFDREMKQKFVDFFSKEHYFDVYYIKIDNKKLTDELCANTARMFNYALRLAISYFVKNGMLSDDDFYLQLDERNEKAETKYFLENYLNTELTLGGITKGKYYVTYFDSSNNKFIQIADIFANLYYSELHTGQYRDEMQVIEKNGMLRGIFEFPPG